LSSKLSEFNLNEPA